MSTYRVVLQRLQEREESVAERERRVAERERQLHLQQLQMNRLAGGGNARSESFRVFGQQFNEALAEIHVSRRRLNEKETCTFQQEPKMPEKRYGKAILDWAKRRKHKNAGQISGPLG